MQAYVKLAILVPFVAGLLDASAAQNAGDLIAQIGSDLVSSAAVTASLANSVRDALVPFGDSLGGQAQQAIGQVRDLANANAAANNELNAALQSLLDSAQTFAETDNNGASIFNGIRKLRTEHDK
ncbi:hypothetical protein PRIC1_007655 [Phytophthora ramorum]